METPAGTPSGAARPEEQSLERCPWSISCLHLICLHCSYSTYVATLHCLVVLAHLLGKATRLALFLRCKSRPVSSVKHCYTSAGLTKIECDHQGSYHSCSFLGLEDQKGRSQDFLGPHLVAQNWHRDVCVDKKILDSHLAI